MQKQTISTGYQNIRQPFENPVSELLKATVITSVLLLLGLCAARASAPVLHSQSDSIRLSIRLTRSRNVRLRFSKDERKVMNVSKRAGSCAAHMCSSAMAEGSIIVRQLSKRAITSGICNFSSCQRRFTMATKSGSDSRQSYHNALQL